MSGVEIMITNGGAHPAYKWADVILRDLIQTNDSAPPDQLAAADKLKADIKTAITPLIEDAQAAERDQRHNAALHFDPHVDEIMAAIKKLTDESMFKGHFDQEHVQAHIKLACSRHVYSAMDIEKSIAADKLREAEAAPKAE